MSTICVVSNQTSPPTHPPSYGTRSFCATPTVTKSGSFFRTVTGIEMRPKRHIPEFRRSHSASAHTPSQPTRSLRRDIPRFLPLTGPYLASHLLSGCRLPRDCRYIHAVSLPKIRFGQGATSVVPSPGLLAPSDLSFSLSITSIPLRHITPIIVPFCYQ